MIHILILAYYNLSSHRVITYSYLNSSLIPLAYFFSLIILLWGLELILFSFYYQFFFSFKALFIIVLHQLYLIVLNISLILRLWEFNISLRKISFAPRKLVQRLPLSIEDDSKLLYFVMPIQNDLITNKVLIMFFKLWNLITCISSRIADNKHFFL